MYTVDIHDHAKILWPQLQEGTNHLGRVIVGFWITQDSSIWHCGLQFNHKKKFICYYVATTGWWWLELWSAMYTLWRQGFFNWIVARAGGYSCGSWLLIHLECTNFAIPWTATVAVKPLWPGLVPNCHSSVLACESPGGLQLQGPIKILQKVHVLPSCPLPSLSTALERLDSSNNGISSEAVMLSFAFFYKPNKLDRLHLQCFAYTIERHSISDRLV